MSAATKGLIEHLPLYTLSILTPLTRATGFAERQIFGSSSAEEASHNARSAAAHTTKSIYGLRGGSRCRELIVMTSRGDGCSRCSARTGQR